MTTNKLATQFPVTRLRVGIAQIGLILAVLYLVARLNYLLFHVLAEVFVAAISLAIFLLAWNARKFAKNNYYLFFGTAFLTSGAISLIHALTYRGMGVVAGTADDANIATQLWLANQYVLAVTFVIAPFLLGKKLKTRFIIWGYLIAFVFFLTAIFYWKIFPAAYIEGSGLTLFKKISEYAVAIAYILSLFFFWKQRRLLEKRVLRLISLTLALFFVSTMLFTLYVGVYSFPNELGHLLRVLAFYVSYLALVEFGLMQPYHSMFRELSESEKALKKAEEEWERTFDSVPDLVAILDNKFRITRVNRAMAERLGKDKEKCAGLKCYACVHNAEKPIANCPHALTLKDGKEHIAEVEEKGLGGTFLVSTTPLFGDDGKLMGSVHVARDITERKQTENTLKESEKRLQRVQEMAHLGSWELDLVKNKLTWSDEAYRIFGLKPGQFSATYEAFLAAVHPDDRKTVDEAYSGSIRDERDTYEIEHRVVRPDGEIRHVHEKCEHFRGKSGKIIRSVGMVHDITGRKKGERALQHEKDKLTQILDNMEDGVYMTTKDYDVTYINPAFKKNFGAKIGNKKCFQYLHNRKSPCPWCQNKKVFSGQSVRWECYFSANKKTFDIIETPITMPDGEPIKLEIFRDVTEKKKIEKDKDEFMSLASHQLRTPLASIGLSSELLLRGVSGKLEEEQKEYLEEIFKTTKRMTLLVNNLLNVSRLEMGTFEMKKGPLDIAAAVRAALKEFNVLVAEKKIALKQHFGESLPTASFGENAFRVVFDNLFVNAIRYTPAGGRIGVEVNRKGKNLVLKVSDTGCGIPEDQKDKIFEKSYRTESAREISSEGAGLGLYMVKSIADRAKAKIWLESRIGKGTTFFFSIPI